MADIISTPIEDNSYTDHACSTAIFPFTVLTNSIYTSSIVPFSSDITNCGQAFGRDHLYRCALCSDGITPRNVR